MPQRLTLGPPHPAAPQAPAVAPPGRGRAAAGPLSSLFSPPCLHPAPFPSPPVPLGPLRSPLSLPRPGPARSDPTRPPFLRPQGQCGAAAPPPVPGHGHQRLVHQLQEGGREPCEVSFRDTEGTRGGCSRCQRLVPGSPPQPPGGLGLPRSREVEGAWTGELLSV